MNQILGFDYNIDEIDPPSYARRYRLDCDGNKTAKPRQKRRREKTLRFCLNDGTVKVVREPGSGDRETPAHDTPPMCVFHPDKPVNKGFANTNYYQLCGQCYASKTARARYDERYPHQREMQSQINHERYQTRQARTHELQGFEVEDLAADPNHRGQHKRILTRPDPNLIDDDPKDPDEDERARRLQLDDEANKQSYLTPPADEDPARPRREMALSILEGIRTPPEMGDPRYSAPILVAIYHELLPSQQKMWDAYTTLWENGEDITQTAVAQILGVDRTTANDRVKRIRQRLQKRLASPDFKAKLAEITHE